MPARRYYGPGGGFVPFVGSAGGWTWRGYDWVIGPGDVDGDGRADLVGRDTRGHAVAAARHRRRVRRTGGCIGERLRAATRSAADRPAGSRDVARSPSRRAGQSPSVGVAHQHERAARHERRQERGHAAPGGGVRVGQQAYAGPCPAPRGRREQLGLACASAPPRHAGGVVGDRVDGRRTRRSAPARARRSRAPRRAAGRRSGPRTGSSEQATTGTGRVVRRRRRPARRRRRRAATSGVGRDGQPGAPGRAEQHRHQPVRRQVEQHACRPASSPSSSVSRLAVLLTQLA